MRSSKLKRKLSSLSARVSQLEYEVEDIKKILKNKGENIYNSLNLEAMLTSREKKSKKKARGSNSTSTTSSNSGLSSLKRRRDSSEMPRSLSSLSSLSSSRSATYMSPVIRQPSYVYQEVPGSAKNHQYGIRPKPSRRRSTGNNKKHKSVSRSRRTKSA